MEGIPQFTTAQRDEARRFVTLLDVLYEEGCGLVCSAACRPDRLFTRLLAEARDMGVNPNLGRSIKVDLSDTSDRPVEERRGGEMLGTPRAAPPSVVSGGGDRQPVEAETPLSSGRRDLSRSLRQEEVLMYNRALSRFGEICREVAPEDCKPSV